MKARILILTTGAVCNNPRSHKEASALSAAGYEVTLLHSEGTPAQSALDDELSHAGGYTREGFALGRAVAPRALSWLARRLVPLGFESAWALGRYRGFLSRATARRADLTIVHTELPLWVGTRLLHSGRRMAADIEDWHSEDLLPEARRHRPLSLLARSEATLLRRASYCSTTSHAMAEALHARYGGERPAVLYNAFPLQPLPTPPRLGEPPALLWFSQTLGPGRGLEAFLDAWSGVRTRTRLVLLGRPVPGYREALVSRVPPARRGLIEFRDHVPPLELPAFVATHDLGLALEEQTPANKNLTVSNKVLQYLNAGLGLLATDTAGQREVLSFSPEAGRLLNLSDPVLTRCLLDKLVSSRELLLEARLAARRLAERHFNWETEARKLVLLVECALKS